MIISTNSGLVEDNESDGFEVSSSRGVMERLGLVLIQTLEGIRILLPEDA